MYQHFNLEVVEEFLIPGRSDSLVAMLRKSKRNR
jgi:hypothetical protein